MFASSSGRSRIGFRQRAVAIGSAVVLMSFFTIAGAGHVAAATSSSPSGFSHASIKLIRSSSTFPFHGVHMSPRGSVPTGNSRLRLWSLNGSGDGGSAVAGTGVGAPRAAGLSKVGGTPQLTAAYDGLSDQTNDSVIGGEVTPPDQGLCSGYDPTLAGDPKVVFELVNEAVQEIYPNGAVARAPFSLANLFGDPYAGGDPRCFYDTSTKAFYFSEIGYVPPSFNTATDLGILNAAGGYAVYQVDTSLGGVEFGDQPKVGFDRNNLYISTDEFGATTYDGAILIAISKSQLNQEVASPNGVLFGPLSFEGGPLLGLEPAINTRANNEYLLNSNPYDSSGNNLPTSNTLGLWEVTNGKDITTGNYSKVMLQSSVLNSETYAFTVPALSTGDGSVTTVDGFPITSETALNPDDDRMLQVIGTGNGSNERLYASLTTAITPSGDSTVRDGAAWFQIRPTYKNPVENQGYVSVAGEYLIYPAIYPTSQGNTMAFTITSPSINPSAGYSVTNSKGNFSGVSTVATGYGPHLSFSDAPPFNRPRWGDYSAAALDPNGKTVWMATEYIPPKVEWGIFDNWGTEIWSLN